MIISILAFIVVIFIMVSLLAGILSLLSDAVNLIKGKKPETNNDFIIWRIFRH